MLKTDKNIVGRVVLVFDEHTIELTGTPDDRPQLMVDWTLAEEEQRRLITGEFYYESNALTNSRLLSVQQQPVSLSMTRQSDGCTVSGEGFVTLSAPDPATYFILARCQFIGECSFS